MTGNASEINKRKDIENQLLKKNNSQWENRGPGDEVIWPASN